jgi:hypothetical protein
VAGIEGAKHLKIEGGGWGCGWLSKTFPPARVAPVGEIAQAHRSREVHRQFLHDWRNECAAWLRLPVILLRFAGDPKRHNLVAVGGGVIIADIPLCRVWITDTEAASQNRLWKPT